MNPWIPGTSPDLGLLGLNAELLALLPIVHLLGLYCTYRAIVHTRTAQGAIAWAVSLVVFPYLSVPLYLVFGRRKFHGYVKARRTEKTAINHIALELRASEGEFRSDLGGDPNRLATMEALAKMPFTAGNGAELLIDGQAIFDSMLAGIERAQDYCLAQFYIVNDDELGSQFKQCLIDKARSGVHVYFLFDEIGCYSLPNRYLEELRREGVHVRPFLTTRGPNNRFQLNFRNHRKIVIVDGHEAWVGGANVGDEYLGRNPKFGAWRDTHMRLTGPCVQCIQLAFLEDWYFATGGIPELDWVPHKTQAAGYDLLVLPTGPADLIETASLFFVHTINQAASRLWIASPYFVPDERVVGALQLAALRGVDVRILLPDKADHLLVYLSSFSYLEELGGSGVKIFRYKPGFLHQKTVLVDDDLSVVGTANLDNRSFRLNFEISVVISGLKFAKRMEEMFERDFERSEQEAPGSLKQRSGWFQFACKAARLASPLQ